MKLSMHGNAIIYFILAAVAFFAIVRLAPAVDSARGKQIHDNACLSCHKSEVYTRLDRRAGSYEELKEQVELWQSHMGLQWPATDIEDVTLYLNEAFYKFECPVASC